jgi:hypothetical protein
MQLRYTKFQVPRGAFADAETEDKIYLFKGVSLLRLTYQIRLLTFRATETNKKLVIRVPRRGTIHRSLKDFMGKFSTVIQIEKV